MIQGGSVGSQLSHIAFVGIGEQCLFWLYVLCLTSQQELCQSLLQLCGNPLVEELHISPHPVDCPPRPHTISQCIGKVGLYPWGVPHNLTTRPTCPIDDGCQCIHTSITYKYIYIYICAYSFTLYIRTFLWTSLFTQVEAATYVHIYICVYIFI